MNERLLRELSHITEEEQDILDGKTGIDRTLYSEGSDFVITSEKMLKEGRLIQFRPHTRFVYFPRHTHNYVEMIYMCSGSTTHIINGTELILQRGELLYFKSACLSGNPSCRERGCGRLISSILPVIFLIKPLQCLAPNRVC